MGWKTKLYNENVMDWLYEATLRTKKRIPQACCRRRNANENGMIMGKPVMKVQRRAAVCAGEGEKT